MTKILNLCTGVISQILCAKIEKKEMGKNERWQDEEKKGKRKKGEADKERYHHLKREREWKKPEKDIRDHLRSTERQH